MAGGIANVAATAENRSNQFPVPIATGAPLKDLDAR